METKGYTEDFQGKRVLVTGGSRGIGRGIAEALLSYGAEVTIVGKNPSNIASFSDAHPTAKSICVDLADWEATTVALTKSCSDKHFHFLVNSAGVFTPDFFMTTTPANFQTTFATNVGAIFSVSQFVAKGMIEAGGGGGIVNISSIASSTFFPFVSVYAASKAAVDRVTKAMAVELGPHGIRANSINCGTVNTDMGRSDGEFYAKNWGNAGLQRMISRTPLPGVCPEGNFMMGMDQVVESVLFLLSPRTAGATTGQQLFVDNGYSVG